MDKMILTPVVAENCDKIKVLENKVKGLEDVIGQTIKVLEKIAERVDNQAIINDCLIQSMKKINGDG